MRTLKLWFLLLTSLAILTASCGSDTADDPDAGTSTTGSSTTGSTTTEPATTETPSTDTSVSGPEPTSTTTTAPSSTTTAPATSGGTGGQVGTVNVRLEPVQGYFIEGFEVGLRFETSSGEVIDALLWSDSVRAAGNPSIDDYYRHVHAQPVPAGQVVVLATVSIGAGPPPVVPDVRGPMQCELAVDVPAGGEVDVEVSFEQQDCLAEV